MQPERVARELELGRIVIVAGFQGITEDLDTTTLGRGGSDTTAVALAASLEAARCEVYTDVEGIYTADPRLVPKARKLDEVDYEEMLELASYGAKMNARSIEMGMFLQGPHPGRIQLLRCAGHSHSRRSGYEHNRRRDKKPHQGHRRRH